MGTNSNPTVDTVENDVMANFTSAWYNYLCTAFSLDRQTFQLVQGNIKLGNDSVALYQMADAIPPMSLANTFSSSTFNRFSSNYGELLNAQIDSTSTALQSALGDQYYDWTAYRKTFYSANPTSTLTQSDLFTTWANQNLDSGKVNAALAAFAKTSIAPVANAIKKYIDPTNKFQKEYMYNQSIDDVKGRLGNSAMAIDFDSSTYAFDSKHSWANGSVGGGFGFFSASASAAYDHLEEVVSGSDITITGSFSTYGTVSIGPKGWFDSGVFGTALTSPNNNQVWDVNANVNWDNFFGTNGTTQRVVGELLVVDGMNLTITSKANFGSLNTTDINADASVSYWPFFSARASGGFGGVMTQNADKSISVTITVGKGNPMILGVNVLPIEKAFQ
jgi:hypothetical protein